jgi:ketosteroid isomerase-like protein
MTTRGNSPGRRQNAEILGSFYAAFNRGELDALLRYLDPEVELYPAVPLPDADAQYLGRRGMREFTRVAFETWDTVIVEPNEIVEAPGERVLAVERWHVGGRDGIELDFQLTDVYAFRDGLIVRIDGFRDKAEALEAAGLTEHRENG